MEHGGNVAQAAQYYQLPLHDWLDLSTGINPYAYPAVYSGAALHTQLPYLTDQFLAAAKNYYDSDVLTPVNGSQQAIHLLPLLRPHSTVAILSPTYSEHALGWRQAGHDVIEILDLDEIINDSGSEYDVVVIVNPNNPTGTLIEKEVLFALQKKLQESNGWLIVDEAFMDCYPEASIVSAANRPGLIVLRSLGKFFGLAGIRIGFVTGDENMVKRIAQISGPWPVSGVSMHMAQQCLLDTAWQQSMRMQLQQQRKLLDDMLVENALQVTGKTHLFSWVEHEDAANIHDALASLGIWLRYFPANLRYKASLRIGLPGNTADMARLQHGLKMIL